jgi:hypothetical protein
MNKTATLNHWKLQIMVGLHTKGACIADRPEWLFYSLATFQGRYVVSKILQEASHQWLTPTVQSYSILATQEAEVRQISAGQNCWFFVFVFCQLGKIVHDTLSPT